MTDVTVEVVSEVTVQVVVEGDVQVIEIDDGTNVVEIDAPGPQGPPGGVTGIDVAPLGVPEELVALFGWNGSELVQVDQTVLWNFLHLVYDDDYAAWAGAAA